MSTGVPEPVRTNAPAPGEGNALHGARRQSVPLDAPDVALRGQRLLVYGERLRWEEIEAGLARHPARPRRPTARQEWLEPVEGQMPAPPAAVGRDDVRIMGQPRPVRAEERIYVEPPGAPEIRRPLDLNAGQPNVTQNGRVMMRPMHLRRDAPVYEDHYKAATAPRIPHRVGVQAQPRLAKLDTFKKKKGQ